MATVRPFQCLRPRGDVAKDVAALPYDVYNREEALQVVKDNAYSFLNIDRAETQFSMDVDTYDDRVYEKASQLLKAGIEDGTFEQDQQACYYLYELTMNGRSQIGLVACSSIQDYEQNVIKKHENTREEKEIDRIRHVDSTNAHTGPIFLAYRTVEKMNQIVADQLATRAIYDFVSEDGIGHRVWRIDDTEVLTEIETIFADIPVTYIADGHHRAASAVKVGQKRRAGNKDHNGTEEYNYFLSVLFPDDQLMIMPYNRVVKDLNGLEKQEFIEKVSAVFHVTSRGEQPYEPDQKQNFGMFLDGQWYELKVKAEIDLADPVKSLDVSILQDYLLNPILNITDPRTDHRIDFIGGIRGLKELERRVHNDMTVAFSLYPTSIQELFRVADANMLMPPKSTWFEPKLRSGLFIHTL